MKKIYKIPMHDSAITDEFAQINNKMVNYAILISMLFSLPGLIGMYMRAKAIMQDNIILFQFLLWIMLLLLYLFRGNISFKFKIISYIGIVIALMFSYAFNIGALGYWSLNVIHISMVIGIFYKRKYAFIVLALLISIIIFIAYLFYTKHLYYGFDALAYLNSLGIWTAMIISVLFISFISIFIVGIQRDYFISSIHQLKNANAKAMLNEKKFRNIFNSSTDAFVISNFEGIILEVNESLLKFLGEKEESLKDKSVRDYILPEFQSIVKERIESLPKLKTLPLAEILVKNAKGEVVPVELNTMLIEYNNGNAVFSVVRDISERKRIEQKIVGAIIKTEEKERSRFAKEIHDGVGPLLSATKIYAKALQKADNDEELKYILSKLNETVDEAIISAQEIANNISPHILENFGLKGAIESFYQKISKTSNVAFHFETNLNERLDINIETTLYRILVEMINNTIKYAGANSISIILMKENGNISLTYSDDGVGFDFQETLKQSTGMGLSNIESRIKSLNGQINMLSEKQNGFKVEIRINL